MKSGLQINNARKRQGMSQEKLVAIAEPNKNYPFIVQPVIKNLDLADWAIGNQEFITTNLLKYGVILFRGFNVTTAPEFERFSRVVCTELFNANGEHPRENIESNVYTPVFYPGDRKLLWHNENSFNHHYPMKILFCCRQPAQQGGETPIVDSRKVFELIDPKIKEKFINKNIMYVRNYGDGFGLNWETVFQTSDQAKVEAYCRQNFIDFEWKSHGGLRTRAIRPAVIKHPKTSEISWFNQAQHWHPACLDTDTRESFFASFTEEDFPRNCYYADGSRIEDSVMREICAVYQQLEVSFPWEVGDVLLLDNVLTAHARNPFVGERKLLVAMGEMTSF
ncbi:TauD/TfdA family dioxygenase [Gloeocapsopsis crepidinum LEGE 06123]|uniref:TauD/TfdA family dioxygenase n=1 Tax=Gloeocapsopsis crepidinum LEGE 06123 TaxID=588587 RepID=A0ABR9UPT1_9CHRO|nr:TauD/TfdA family dioxygenase [Gloeocapsopsis crepidinum]MBE9190293.1 TauD/TfdA family dioxygenase [Gloeocapsopsis crepidinum LEGE 06123]